MLIQTGVTYKRTAKCRTVQSRDLPADWTETELAHYAKTLSQTLTDGPPVTAWWHGNIIGTYIDGKLYL